MTTTPANTSSSALALRGGSQLRTEPFPAWPIHDERDAQAVADVVRSGEWGVGGPYTAKFEQVFAEYVGCKHGLTVTSGTTALQIAVLAAGLREGDEVIVPPLTFLATGTAVVEANGTPIFVDIDPETWNLDAEQIEAAITPRTRAIIPVHYSGLPADMERIMAIAEKHDLVVIEDAAHSHGGIYDGRKTGSLGHMACFSFQSTKNLASGEGGFISTNNEEFAQRCRSIHNCGRSPKGHWYEHHTIAGNYRMTQMQAALLLSQFERLEDQAVTRDANGKYLADQLAQVPGITPLARPEKVDRHPYHLFTFAYEAETFGLPRETFIEAVVAEGIPVGRLGNPPLYTQPVFVNKEFGPYTGYKHHRPDLDYASVHLPVVERAFRERGCHLMHQTLLGERSDVDDIVAAIQKVYEHRQELQG